MTSFCEKPPICPPTCRPALILRYFFGLLFRPSPPIGLLHSLARPATQEPAVETNTASQPDIFTPRQVICGTASSTASSGLCSLNSSVLHRPLFSHTFPYAHLIFFFIIIFISPFYLQFSSLFPARFVFVALRYRVQSTGQDQALQLLRGPFYRSYRPSGIHQSCCFILRLSSPQPLSSTRRTHADCLLSFPCASPSLLPQVRFRTVDKTRLERLLHLPFERSSRPFPPSHA